MLSRIIISKLLYPGHNPIKLFSELITLNWNFVQSVSPKGHATFSVSSDWSKIHRGVDYTGSLFMVSDPIIESLGSFDCQEKA